MGEMNLGGKPLKLRKLPNYSSPHAFSVPTKKYGEKKTLWEFERKISYRLNTWRKTRAPASLPSIYNKPTRSSYLLPSDLLSLHFLYPSAILFYQRWAPQIWSLFVTYLNFAEFRVCIHYTFCDLLDLWLIVLFFCFNGLDLARIEMGFCFFLYWINLGYVNFKDQCVCIRLSSIGIPMDLWNSVFRLFFFEMNGLRNNPICVFIVDQ